MDDETATDLDSNVEGEDIHLEGKNEFDLNWIVDYKFPFFLNDNRRW
jgi:hypothetical protein